LLIIIIIFQLPLYGDELSEHITANQSGQGSGTSGGTVPLTVNY
jgi:hypothetical protein